MKYRIKRKDIDGSDRLTAVCVCQGVKTHPEEPQHSTHKFFNV